MLALLAASDRAAGPASVSRGVRLAALFTGVVALIAVGSAGWAQGIAATAAFLAVAVLIRAVPPEVFDAVTGPRATRR